MIATAALVALVVLWLVCGLLVVCCHYIVGTRQLAYRREQQAALVARLAQHD